jgi:septum formation inhibitor-activating ATPase MinD
MYNLVALKKCIEDMSKYHQIQVLKILKSNKNVVLNENNNGIFINLSEQSEEIINSLKDYAKYVKDQQNDLSHIENQKKIIANKFFKDNKELYNIIMNNEQI